ncbi:hypothetical protein Pla52n_46610 [Stieleria varia]|uniref:Uncharacterized protein n=1 Tax=Stieleria varia TaxID=2528005 RepID=A0A5C6AP49_9BACT|nr:hypothetical protein Pla52n_46610 [Stieleria varia]
MVHISPPLRKSLQVAFAALLLTFGLCSTADAAFELGIHQQTASAASVEMGSDSLPQQPVAEQGSDDLRSIQASEFGTSAPSGVCSDNLILTPLEVVWLHKFEEKVKPIRIPKYLEMVPRRCA